MSEEQRLRQKIASFEQRWNKLSDQIGDLTDQRDRETRADEKYRLREVITEKETERQTVEAEWQKLEAELISIKHARLVQDARKLESNKAYPEAIQTWQKIAEFAPEDAMVAGEIARLEEKQRQFQQLVNLMKNLPLHLQEIGDNIFNSVMQHLQQLKGIGTEGDVVVAWVQEFLERKLSAEDFKKAWQALESQPTEMAGSKQTDRILAERLQRGEIALFLGSDIAGELDISGLASQARYEDFAGSLSKIAEYYQITELGRSSLIRELSNLLSASPHAVSFYDRLAVIEQPLLVVSATYDTLLEEAFRTHGKKFVLICSIIHGTKQDVGRLFIEYSDRAEPEPPCLEEALSGLEPLEKGYSVIYKIRGYCGSPSAKHSDYYKPIKTGIYLANYNLLKIPMALSSKGHANRSRKAVSQ